jgi:hypothetical protein
MRASSRDDDLVPDFTAAVWHTKLDEPGRRQPHGMMAVDYVVEEPSRWLLVEIKDPSDPTIPPENRPEERERERKKRRGSTFVNEELVPKARDSYTYMHLMARDTKPFVFVVLDDWTALGLDDSFLEPLQSRLKERLAHEAEEPWERQCIAQCVIANPTTWAARFPDYPLRRRSSTHLQAPDGERPAG